MNNFKISFLRIFITGITICLFAFVGQAQILGSLDSDLLEINEYYVEIEEGTDLKDVLDVIEQRFKLVFLYRSDALVDAQVSRATNIFMSNVENVLETLLADTGLEFKYLNPKTYGIYAMEEYFPEREEIPVFQQEVTGTVTDAESGESLPGVSVSVEGTAIGTSTDPEGAYTLSVPDADAVIQFSFIGYTTERVQVEGRSEIDVSLTAVAIDLDEIVVVGYGTMRRGDLTGSLYSADMETFRGSPNVSVMQSLHGTVPGFEVGQVDRPGQDPSIRIRGTSSISGSQDPLIVLDDVIYRGNLIDINPNDVESINILKDASATAIYGSQATNGVILINTKRGGGVDGKPTINYSASYSNRSPTVDLRPGTAEDYINSLPYRDLLNAFTEESGYTERDPNWSISSHWKDGATPINHANGYFEEDWYGITTNDHMFNQSHNVSIANRLGGTNYMVSLGLVEEWGEMINDDYTRMNARINLDNDITEWLHVALQTFITTSDASGRAFGPSARYNNPYSPVRVQETGELRWRIADSMYNPFYALEEPDENKRNHFFGNIAASIEFPFVEGLEYRFNFGNNFRSTRRNFFRNHIPNFEGTGYKSHGHRYEYVMDNLLSYQQRFRDIHSVDVTLLYGLEERTFNSTTAEAERFANLALGYHSLQAGQSDLQSVSTNAWEESSLYSMARLNYGFDDKYLLTATVRRDGFSGFSEAHKFGVFPSLSLAWVASEESFVQDNAPSWMEYFKFRVSYGSTGNRTIGRYHTLARVAGGFNYLDENHNSVFTQSITDLASPELKWETTTGTNIGFDFGILSRRIQGSIDYYNNNTTDILYDVDIPGISRFENFPDNLGKLHNQGFEFNINTINIDRADFTWRSSFTYSRNRNELKTLLGIDTTGDGREDDLISEGLFIGEALDAIYDYQTTGEKWQIGEEVPTGFTYGVNKVVDLNGDGVITPDDKTIIGYREPAYRFGITNTVNYKNWRLSFFINSIQSGRDDNRYLAADHARGFAISNQHSYLVQFPEGLDYWRPDNPDARYQRPWTFDTAATKGDNYISRSFVRLQDVQLSYQFPTRLIGRLAVQNLRLYFNGKNLMTWTDWPGWDPETGSGMSYGGRPVMKSYTVGLDIEF